MRTLVLAVLLSCGADEAAAPAPDPFGDLPVSTSSSPMPRGRTVVWLGANGTYAVARTADGPRETAADVDAAAKLVLAAASARGGAAAGDARAWTRERLGRRSPSAGQLPVATPLPPRELTQLSPIIVAWPHGSAMAIAELATRVGGVIAVATPDGVAAIHPVGFAAAAPGSDDAPRDWIELVGDSSGLTLVDPAHGLEVVSQSGAIDPIALRAIVVRRAPQRLELLAGAGMTAQQLVDVLRALADHTIAIGATTEDAAARARTIAEVTRLREVRIGQPNAQGDLPKAEIKAVVKTAAGKLADCYDAARQRKPALSGTVATQFVIAADGTVSSSNASGVDPTVAQCVTVVVKGLRFPKVRGGGIVQVNFPFTFRAPAE